MTIASSTSELRERSRILGHQAADVEFTCESISPMTVASDEAFSLEVAAEATNNTIQTKVILLRLLVNGVVVDEQEVTLDVVETESVTFSADLGPATEDARLNEGANPVAILRQGTAQLSECGDIVVEAPTGDPTEEPTGDPTEEPTGDPTEEPAQEPAEPTGPKVTLSCDGFSPQTASSSVPTSIQTTARFENNVGESVPIVYDVFVGDQVVDGANVTVPAGETITDTLEFDVSPAILSGPGGSVPVVLRQRFGFQQEASCGSLQVESPEVPTEPQTELSQEQLIGIAAFALVLILLIAR